VRHGNKVEECGISVVNEVCAKKTASEVVVKTEIQAVRT